MTIEQRFFEVGRELFGGYADPVVEALAGKVVGHSSKAHVKFDDETGKIHRVYLPMFAPRGTLAHEFGHCMHCHYWPTRSATCPEEAAERAAYWCEMHYASSTAKAVHVSLYGTEPHRSAAKWLLKGGYLLPVKSAEAAFNRLREAFHAEA